MKLSQLQNTKGGVASRVLMGVVIATLVAVVIGGALLYEGSSDGEKVELIIPRGATLRQVADLLHKTGVVSRPGFFKFILRVTGGASKVHAGEFAFTRNMRAKDAIATLYFSEPITHAVTIPEGYSARQIADLLHEQRLADRERFISLTLSPQAATKFNLPGPNLEGYLYPDTYHFSRVDTEERIVERMVSQFIEVLEKDLRKEIELKKANLLELVTLASIVEKETGEASERPLVASVFANRLKKGMRLQSDPTTIYGILNFNGNLTRADLLRPTPYNTYVIPRLPPGPICNPGLASLKAVLNPATSKYFYFVANKKGGHVFSETYSEHTRHVNAYQK